MANLALRIKQLRRERGITQTELAALLKTARSAVSNWENGTRQPRNDKIVMMCNYFDVSVDYLYGRVDARNRVIMPPTVNIDITKLNRAGQEHMEMYYKFLLGMESMRS